MPLRPCRLAAMLMLAIAAPAAAQEDPARCAAADPAAQWRSAASEDDRRRLRSWRRAWTEALAKAQAEHGPAVTAEGALLRPDAALPRATPPPGPYRCRTIKVGAQGEGGLDFIAYPWFECRIAAEGGELRLEKLTGSQRPVGRLLADTDRRMIFLGTLVLSDEQRALRYGEDRERDMAGILERIGDSRWRLVFPYPRFESTLDVIELVPAS